VSCKSHAYQQHRLRTDMVIQHGVAEALPGVGIDQVRNINMVPVLQLGSHAHLLRGESDAIIDDSSSVLTFEVSSLDPDMTYEGLKAQIEEAASFGTLVDKIRAYGAEYDVQELALITMGEPTVTEATAAQNSASGGTIRLSARGVVGVVAGCALLLALMA
jgi:hypothetical protein